MNRRASDFAEQFRYADDLVAEQVSASGSSEFEILEIHDSLLITKVISPQIYGSLERVCANLELDHQNINLYVNSSSEINARCYRGINQAPVVILTSALASLLETKELDFVIGHELGHLLLGHTTELKQASQQGMHQSRSKEISVDRIGLVASRDLDATLRAIIKTISGLTSQHINFNVAEFINQIRKFDADASAVLSQRTHPSFLLRTRALLRFHSSDKYQRLFGREGKNLSDIDVTIKRDMEKYVDKSLKNSASQSKTSLSFWITCLAAVADNELSQDEQQYIVEHYGFEKLQKFKELISGRSQEDVQTLIADNVRKAIIELSNVSESALDDMERIIQSVSSRLHVTNLSDRIQDLLSK